MFRFKSPSLLFRVSHLIFIQILFIFSALALMLFYPQDDSPENRAYADLNSQANLAAERVINLIDSNMTGFEIPSDILDKIQEMADSNEYITDISLLCHDTLNNVDKMIRLAVSEREKIFLDSSRTFINGVVGLLSASRQQYISGLSQDGEHVLFAIRPNNALFDRTLVIACPNITGEISRSKQAYFLFLLFLVSALISLLIINLISKGVRRPLGDLIKGFEKTASGQQFQMEEKGDKYIRSLIHGFNIMSQKLSENRQELAGTNERLMKANKSLIESESILTALVDYSPDAVIVTDLEDQVIIYNQAAARDFGYNQTNLLGKKISHLIPVVNNEKKEADRDDNLNSQEVICRRSDGSRFPSVLVHTPLGAESGHPMAMLYFVKSISESANYQDMILKLDRIASRGKMARDIAHEINNYLAILQGNLELIPMFMAKNDNEKIEKKLEVMKDTVARITTFTEGLTRFSDENSEFAKVDINQLMENLIAFLKPQNKFDDIFICTNLSEDLPLVEIDASQFQHLMVHLITNAAEAITDAEDNRWIVVSTAIEEDSHTAIIKVADSGPGVEGDHIGNLFVKRFSTKRSGTGLGLLTCKNIVDNHQGELSYHSEEDSKSIFEVKVPISRSDSAGKNDEINKTEVPATA